MTEIEKLREAISHLGGSGEQSEFSEGYDAAIRDVLRAIDAALPDIVDGVDVAAAARATRFGAD